MMIYNEYINLENARYILSLEEKVLVEIFKEDKKENEHGEKEKCDPLTYVGQMTRWLKRAIKEQEKNGFIRSSYSHSKNLVKCGRIYVENFGVQRLQKTFRGFLIKDYVNDYDMCNCHPTILNNIIDTTFPEHRSHFPLIEKYITNRNYFIKENGIEKTEVLISMNSDKKQIASTQLFARLDLEFKEVQKLIWNEYEKKVKVSSVLLRHKNSLTKNKYGRFLNVILVEKENEILQEAMEMFGDKVHTPMFDGFTMHKDIDMIEALNKLNSLTEDRGVRWDTKDHSDKIVIDEGVEINCELEYTYEEQKERFETNHFIIENPFLFGSETNIDGEYGYYFENYANFRLKSKPVKYFDMHSKNNKNPVVEFVPSWIEDENRKHYKEIRFVPEFTTNPDYFNSFRGFRFEVVDEEMLVMDRSEFVIKSFTDHISLLVNHCEESKKYLLSYISHIFQKPKQKPMVSIIFKSKQGFGKDLLVDFISNMLGSKFITRTQKLDDIFGNFNTALKDKLVLQFSETSGRDGYAQTEQIKDLITTEFNQIREKYIAQYKQKNYIRLLILSNNRNPIKIPHDDRRFAVFRSHHIKPEKDYYDNLGSILANDNDLQMLFNYLSSYDIENFDPTNRPLTNAYENMKEHNINPIYEFLYNMFEKEEVKECMQLGECLYQKSKDTYYVKSKSLLDAYETYLISENRNAIVPNYKDLKSVLNEMGIDRVEKMMRKVRGKYYKIEMKNLREQLRPFNFDEEIEELEDLEDFEEIGYSYEDRNLPLLPHS